MKNNEILVKDLGVLSYDKSWEHQKRIFDNIISQKINNRTLKKKIKTENHLLIVEHKPIYTIGKSGEISNLLLDDQELKLKGIDFKKINRGGDITFHGLGQIVGYPILDLDNFFTDIGLYLRTLEEVIISTIGFFGIKGFRIDGETGVWVKDELNSLKKICAFGIKASRWVTMHGFALNVNTDLTYFDNIVPCGISDKGVTSLQEILNQKIAPKTVKEKLYENIARLFNAELSMTN
ncbi:MAG TPA: lipoyl(octanoyl) transferase LipB [Flavobacteriaceae bacterium]|jgi:lipoyl(octanoyl) transferase|nr:lipoyl(octanoyl) transferase LipB [Flavobacteriaceae bacterium]HJO70650.1 lipoyl(octanoyl) transferase LipB [Flavobacteriaceae bacterium]|tara:strand:- start:1857 stop:2564 length:708 start_codon:yes stop_codon:yes gene_type:complete